MERRSFADWLEDAWIMIGLIVFLGFWLAVTFVPVFI